MVSAATIFDEVTEVFYNRLKADVTEITLRNLTVVPIKFISFAWPDRQTYNESHFPTIVIENDDAEEDDTYSYGNDEITNIITIEFAAVSTEEVTKLSSSIFNSIRNYENEFAEAGITNVRLLDKDNGPDEFGGLRVRSGILRYELTFRLSK